jgi:hypothetical protein
MSYLTYVVLGPFPVLYVTYVSTRNFSAPMFTDALNILAVCGRSLVTSGSVCTFPWKSIKYNMFPYIETQNTECATRKVKH